MFTPSSHTQCTNLVFTPARILLILVLATITLFSAGQNTRVLADQPVYNTPFLTDQQLEDYQSMDANAIRAFLASNNSYFKQTIKDVDGVSFDPATIIAQAASQYQINPKAILATLEKENTGVTRTTRPSDSTLRFLMGCVKSTTARQQLTCTAERFRAYQNQQANNGSTASGWKVGVAKRTQDGVTVTPATKAAAGQFTYTPYAGVSWGGNARGVGGVGLFYSLWNKFGFGSGSGSGPVACPSSGAWQGEYFTNISLSGSRALCRNDASLSFNWGGGSPDPKIPSDNFSARWTRSQTFDSATYRFTLAGDDGIRLWVDGNLVIDAWKDQSRTVYQKDVALATGGHTLKVEFYEHGGDANVSLDYQKFTPQVSCSGQYKAEYFNNRTLSGSPTYTVCEGWPVSHDWGSGGPGNGVGNDNFSIRWSGRAHINSGTYDFVARADDGIRVYLNGERIIDAWKDQGPTEYHVTRTLNNGDYDIKVEYYENGGGAVAQFRWDVKTTSGGGGGSDENLARGKPASATSQESSSKPPSNGNDGNSSTRWSSRISTNLGTEWWRVDLGSERSINQVVIQWETAYASSFFLCWSTDNSTCHGVTHTVTGAGTNTYNIGSQRARYVWLRMDSRAPKMNNYSFYELEVYNRSTAQLQSGEPVTIQQAPLPALK